MPRSFKTHPNTLFGRRLREARLRAGIPQDQLGVAIGLDESCSSARISRYETGIHEPPLTIAEKLAEALAIPLPYFYCEDDRLAELIMRYATLDPEGRERVLAVAVELGELGAGEG
jgi:transcriptional regulator with XRE-family HTH domain